LAGLFQTLNTPLKIKGLTEKNARFIQDKHIIFPVYFVSLQPFKKQSPFKISMKKPEGTHAYIHFPGFPALFTSLLFALLTCSIQAQTYTLSGYVRDSANGEELIGASVVAEKSRQGTVTNNYGFYNLSLPAGTHNIVFSYIGYQTVSKTVVMNGNKSLNISLFEGAVELQAVEVTTTRADENIRSTQMSVAKLTSKEIKKIPQLLGEVDVVRTITLLPGISTVGEGANGFNVRGGNVDQNLILLDDAPIYSSSHLFGFFSIFNADAVTDVKIFKGGIPATYGGRLSSVLDVRQKNGNMKKFEGDGGLGLLSSRLLLEGPIVKDKVSFMVSGRRSYQDIFIRMSSNEDFNSTILYFYDLNAKLNYKINDKNRLFLSGYFGRDVFGLRDFFNFGWGNSTGTLRWNSLFSDKLFANFTAVYSDYTYYVGTDGDISNFTLNSRIQNTIFKNDYTWYATNNQTVSFGFEGIYYQFSPGRITGDFQAELSREYATEGAIYVANDHKINSRFSLQYGLRFSGFANLGPRTVRSYDADKPLSENTVLDSRDYASGEIVASYLDWKGLEPRFAANYILNDQTSLKLSYNRTRQYIHQISNTTTPTPIDLWRPSGPFILPASANQIAGGVFRNFKQNEYQFSAEIYYKSLDNMVDYKDGANLIFNDFIETELLTGIGRAYGIELMIEKKTGKLTGWISYALARTERLVDGINPEEQINNGEWYPANFDKPHDLTIVATYAINPKWDLGTTFAYQTGRPITFPNGRAEFEGIIYPVYANRNGARIPDYHRLDISANYNPGENKQKRFKSSWSFGIYNVYARRNPYSIFFRQNPDMPQVTEAVRLAIFANLIPFVTYNFKF
jgi:hypothetical protein